MPHKKHCKDTFGNSVPCSYEVKAMWSFLADLPPLPDGFQIEDFLSDYGYTPGHIPSLRSIVGLLGNIAKLSVGKVKQLIFTLADIGVGWGITFIKWLIYEQIIWLEDQTGKLVSFSDLRSGNIDLNYYAQEVYDSIINNVNMPVYVRNWVPKTLPFMEQLKFHIPEVEQFFDRFEALLESHKENPIQYIWYLLGFTPNDMVPYTHWIYDAGGYVMEEGQTGSEFFDDWMSFTLTIIVPDIGLIVTAAESIQDVWMQIANALRIYNDAAEMYNSLRIQITLGLMSLQESIIGFVSQLTNSLPASVWDDSLSGEGLFDTFIDVTHHVFKELLSQFDELPVMPMFPEDILDEMEYLEFTWAEDGIAGLINSLFAQITQPFTQVEFITSLVSWIQDMNEVSSYIFQEDNVDTSNLFDYGATGSDSDQSDDGSDSSSGGSDGSSSDGVPPKIWGLE